MNAISLRQTLLQFAAPISILAATTASLPAQSPHVGMYVGDLMIELSGPFNSGPTASGRMIFNVFPDGTVAEIGGDPVGTVDAGGNIIWEQPNTFNFSTGSIANATLFSQSSTTENTLTRTLTIQAELLGGAFPAGQTFTNQLVDLAPLNGYRDHNQVIAANGGFIAVGKSGTVALSDDGLTWRRSAAPTARDLYSIAYGNGTYLAVGDHGTLLTSTDGVNWVPRNTPFQFNLGITGVTFGDGKFVISSQFSNIATSTDGIAWNVAPETLASFQPGKLRYLDGQFVFWAGTNIRFSNDAVTWSAPVDTAVLAINDVARGDGLWVVAGDTGIKTSGDGSTWTLVSSLTQVRTIAYGNGRFMANIGGLNGAPYYATGAGATAWRRANGPTGSQSAVFDGERFVMVGAGIITSEDGISWRALRSDTRAAGALPQQIFTNTDGTRSLMDVWRSGLYETFGNTLWVGPNGQAYLDSFQLKSPVDTQTDADLYAVANKFIGGEGGVIRKVDTPFINGQTQLTVTPINSPTTATLRSGMNYGSHTLMVGDGGTIVRFSGATTATLEASGTTENLRYAAYVETNNTTALPSLVMIVGDNGTMLVRPWDDTTNAWVARNTGTTANLIGVGYLTAGFSNNTNARYIAVGEDGTVITSVDSITWTEENPLNAPVPLETFRRYQGQFSYEVSVAGQGYSAVFTTTADGVHATGGSTIVGDSFTPSRIVHGGDRFVVVGGKHVSMSFDGRDWQSRLTVGDLRDVTYGEGVFVAVGGALTGNSSAERVSFSYDGLTWHTANQPTTTVQLQAVDYHNGRFITLGQNATILSSENGIDWELVQANFATDRRITDMASGNGVIVGVGTNGAGSRRFIMSSVDGGETWAVRQDLSSGRNTSVAYGNGTFVVVSFNSIRRSTDGINFNSGTSIAFNQSSTGSEPTLDHVFFADGVFVATTTLGQAYVSSDAITWEERFTGIRGAVTGAAVANGQALLATSEKIISLAVSDAGSPYVVQQPQDASVLEGGVLTLTATATGNGPLSYQWTRNGVALQNGGRISGADTLTLQITGATAADAGDYRLVVTNALGGRTSRAADVAVILRPIITGQPQSVTAAPGDEVVLTVSAAGEGLSYQWFKNGAIMPGETGADLVIDPASAASAALYTVEVSNLAGTVPSQSAAVSISSPPGGSLDLTLNTAFNANVPELRSTNVVFSFGTFPAFALRQVLVQPDGKLLVVGQFEYTGIGGQTRHSLIRLNSNGMLDTTFNVPTLQTDGFNSTRSAALIEQVALLPDGRIILTGSSIQRIGGTLRSATKSAMLNADGTLATFAPSLSSSANPYTVAVDSANRILYAGNNITSGRPIRRFSAAGALDSGFSGASLGHDQAMNHSLVIQSDDKPVYSAYTTDFLSIRTHRTTTGGSIDATFQSATFAGTGLFVNSHTRLPDDAFLVNGRFTSVDGTPRSGIAKFSANGQLDTTFAPNGEIGGTGAAHSTVPLGGGFYLTGGQFTTPTASNLAALRADGSLVEIPAFGSGTNVLVNSVATNADATIAYALGNFSTLNGQAVPKVIRFDVSATTGGDPVDLEIIAVSPGRSFVDGDEVVLAVAATGGNLQYQWFKGDDELEGETGMTLVISNMTEANAGTYRVEVRDASGMVPSGDIVLTYQAPPPSGFAGWPALLDLPENLRGPNDTPAGDGVPNLVKYAIGVGPLDSAAGRIPQEVLESTVNDQTYPTACIVRDTTVTGLTMQVEVATDLDFTMDLGTTVVSTQDLGNGLEQICVRSNVRFADATKQFFRLKVSED